MARNVISTQREWEEVRERSRRRSEHRLFSADFEFNRTSPLRLTCIDTSEALPQAKLGGPTADHQCSTGTYPPANDLQNEHL